VTVVFAHAVGFCKELWAPVLHELSSVLGSAIPRVNWLALDFSGHGSSRPSPLGGTWDRSHPQEVAEVMRAEAVSSSSPVLGVGHSMGGAVLTSLELREPNSFSHGLAIEPPLFTRALSVTHRALSAVGRNPLANAASRRRGTWPSLQAAREHFARRSGAGWDPRALDAWVGAGFHDLREGGTGPPNKLISAEVGGEGTGFRDSREGGTGPHNELLSTGTAIGEGAVELRCSPETEARSFSWPGEPIESLTRRYAGNCNWTLATCADSRFSPVGIPGTARAFYRFGIAPAFPAGRVEVRPAWEGVTHLVVMEKPGLVAGLIAEELQPMLAKASRG
jgi:pimeloyl-ACP methyl ester carboxylesterase